MKPKARKDAAKMWCPFTQSRETLCLTSKCVSWERVDDRLGVCLRLCEPAADRLEPISARQPAGTRQRVHPDSTLIAAPDVWRKLGIGQMTAWRWQRSPEMNFPPRIKMGKRIYFRREEIDAWILQQARKTTPSTSFKETH